MPSLRVSVARGHRTLPSFRQDGRISRQGRSGPRHQGIVRPSATLLVTDWMHPALSGQSPNRTQGETRMPMLKEVPEVAKLLATILTGEPVTHGALAVIPLLAPNLDDPGWLTLQEAGDRARVTEVSEAGSVPFLRMANGADRPLLLLDGEELIGAKQNRILNTTVLVAAHTEVIIPVSCVEQGRWGYRGRQFHPGDASLYASLRARKAAHVNQSLRAGRGHRADQSEVWAHLADRASRLRVVSATGAMRDVYARHQADLMAARQAL